jgi:hypothetical protein
MDEPCIGQCSSTDPYIRVIWVINARAQTRLTQSFPNTKASIHSYIPQFHRSGGRRNDSLQRHSICSNPNIRIVPSTDWTRATNEQFWNATVTMTTNTVTMTMVALSAAMNFDGLRAGFALDVAAPVILAVASLTNLDRLGLVATSAAHRSTTTAAAWIFVAGPEWKVHIQRQLTTLMCGIRSQCRQ